MNSQKRQFYWSGEAAKERVLFINSLEWLHRRAFQASLFCLQPNQLPKKRKKQLSQIDKEMNQSLERTRGLCERIIGRKVEFFGPKISKPEESIWVEIEFDSELYNYSWVFQTFLTYARTLMPDYAHSGRYPKHV